MHLPLIPHKEAAIMAKRTITGAVALALVLLAGTAFAADKPKLPFAGTVHATAAITYKDGSDQTWTWDRGKVASLSSSSISLMRRDKVEVSFTLSSSTVVRGELAQGDVATVISQDGAAVIVRNIKGDPNAAAGAADAATAPRPLKGAVTGTVDALYYDGSQKSFDVDFGRITTIGDGSLTITRLDKQTVTLSYDASTPVWERGHLEDASVLQQGDGGAFFSQGGTLAVVHGLRHAKQPQS
jgi:hypothetical protein